MDKKIKKIVKYSVALMVIGLVIGGIGFGMLGFKKEKLESKKDHAWYYTVNYTEDGGLTAGIGN